MPRRIALSISSLLARLAGAESVLLDWGSIDQEFDRLYRRCRPFTMTSRLRMEGLYQAVRHVLTRGIPGDIVECGVWKVGSSMLAAMVLIDSGDVERSLYLYDTFEGMTEPEERDVDHRGLSAKRQLSRSEKREDRKNVWAYCSLESVRANLVSTGLPEHRVRFVKGPVEKTIPGTLPKEIAVLRLDTDWYASTHHELVHLYPRLSPGGVLIVDDYGHWEGARQAVDEYFSKQAPPLLLQRLDYTGRIAVKA